MCLTLLIGEDSCHLGGKKALFPLKTGPISHLDTLPGLAPPLLTNWLKMVLVVYQEARKLSLGARR